MFPSGNHLSGPVLSLEVRSTDDVFHALSSSHYFSYESFLQANRSVCRRTSDPLIFLRLYFSPLFSFGQIKHLVVDAHHPRNTFSASQPTSLNVSLDRICRSATQHFPLTRHGSILFLRSSDLWKRSACFQLMKPSIVRTASSQNPLNQALVLFQDGTAAEVIIALVSGSLF